MISDSLLAAVCDVALQAGQVILEIYDQAYEVIEKADGSPVTVADHRAHDLISEQLAPLLPGTPVLSEESSEITYQQRADWSRFWLVDPLDGTKEFIRRNGEFTVNIGLIENGFPILGVVHTPVRRTTHFCSHRRWCLASGRRRRRRGDHSQTLSRWCGPNGGQSIPFRCGSGSVSQFAASTKRAGS